MAFIEDHEKDCIRFMNRPYTHIHEWLDQYAKFFPVGFFDEYHRTFLHNSYGLECIKSLWGYDGLKAARIHLIRDYVCCPLTMALYNKYEEIKNFNKMMIYYNNPIDIKVHNSVIQTRIKEGFSLVALATRDMVKYGR